MGMDEISSKTKQNIVKRNSQLSNLILKHFWWGGIILKNNLKY